MHCEVLVGCIVQFAQRTYRCVDIAKCGSVTVPLIFGELFDRTYNYVRANY